MEFNFALQNLWAQGGGPADDSRSPRNDLELRHVHHPAIRDLERRNHRQRQKSQLQEGFVQRDAQPLRCRTQGDERIVHLLEGSVAHQARDRQRKLRQHRNAFVDGGLHGRADRRDEQGQAGRDG